MWLENVAAVAEPVYRELFEQSRAIAIFFYAASIFSNIETDRFDRGSFFVACEARRAPFAPYGKALNELRDGLAKLEH